MSYLHYHHTSERDRSPYHLDEDPYYSRPLVRRNSKRQRIEVYNDDEYDDYPGYSSHSKPSKPSRSLTIRQPSQLEKYNVWSYPSSSSHHHHRYHDDSDDSHRHKYKYTRKTYATRPSDDENDSRFDVEFKATYRRPTSSGKAMAWPGELFKRREKWDGVEWESRERERGDDFWDEPQLKERTVKYRRIKRTKTDEWKPLSGFKHW
ncbi:hypothetical protein K469DRAFT_717205 [Zopfia rhizophila CBS 207.26]|uniref:Uncharacterized protein n=1 Tax=Zopfia rhizophila CBS 207.26 TaxID=1314779 RepID=A0A6A6ENL6_9PEZI|nr:hypothetical protein K469DRAFT_717205 [Zopfia rhizophila CBS 207.26]